MAREDWEKYPKPDEQEESKKEHSNSSALDERDIALLKTYVWAKFILFLTSKGAGAYGLSLRQMEKSIKELLRRVNEKIGNMMLQLPCID